MMIDVTLGAFSDNKNIRNSFRSCDYQLFNILINSEEQLTPITIVCLNYPLKLKRLNIPKTRMPLPKPTALGDSIESGAKRIHNPYNGQYVSSNNQNGGSHGKSLRGDTSNGRSGSSGLYKMRQVDSSQEKHPDGGHYIPSSGQAMATTNGNDDSEFVQLVTEFAR